MRSRLAHAIVFICAYCLFRGYCQWWSSHPETAAQLHAQSTPDFGTYLVEGAADETFNGVYMPFGSCNGMPCFMKDEPHRFLWQSASRWHLSTEPGMLADGYMTEKGGSVSARWVQDGSSGPPHRVMRLPEFTDDRETAAVSPSASPPRSGPASPDGIPATSPG